MMARFACRAGLPALLVSAGSLALEIAYGTRLGDALLYTAYEVAFVVIPGCLAYRALTGRAQGALRQLAMGWALGYVLEVLAFMLTAASGARPMFAGYPIVVGAVAVLARRRWPAGSRRTHASLPRRFRWLLAFVCLGAVTYIALSYFPGTPLPGSRTVNYSQDYPWAVSLAAEAKHHWPIQDPNVAGEPMPYHYFVNIHLAAASQMTGLGLPLVYFRLFISPLVVALILSLVVAGQSLARSAYAGLVAACLTFFVGELQLDARQSLFGHVPFLGVLFTLMVTSPSFLFGLVLFVPLVTLVGERVSGREEATRRRDWLLVALFMIGASGAKVSILPLVLVALLAYAGWRWAAERRVPGGVWWATALVLLVSGTVYGLLYRTHSSGLGVAPFASFHDMPAVLLVRAALTDALPRFPGEAVVLSALGVVFGGLGLLAAPLVGLPWIARCQRHRLRAEQAWLLSLLAAGLLALVALSGEGTGNQLYFLFYGLVAGCVLSADGLRKAWGRRPELHTRSRRIAALALGWLAFLAALVAVPLSVGMFSGPLHDAYTYLVLYGALGLSLVVLYMAAKRWVASTRWVAASLLCAAVLLVGALDTPIDNLVSALTNPPAAPSAGRRMTRRLYGALTWIRDRTTPDSVIAVNSSDQFEFDYAAFSERRVFLGGWAYSQRSRDQGYAQVANGLTNPFADRLKLGEEVFMRGDRAALRRVVTRYGVRYLLVDEINGYRADLTALKRVAVLVYRTPDVAILKVI